VTLPKGVGRVTLQTVVVIELEQGKTMNQFGPYILYKILETSRSHGGAQYAFWMIRKMCHMLKFWQIIILNTQIEHRGRQNIIHF